MKKKKLIITQEQFQRLNEEIAVDGGEFTGANLGKLTTSNIRTLTRFKNTDPTVQNNAPVVGTPDDVRDNPEYFAKAPVVKLTPSNSDETMMESRYFTKKAVEEARIRTIKQEGKTYTKKDFARMILGK